jgi:hypothetical protein
MEIKCSVFNRFVPVLIHKTQQPGPSKDVYY